MRPITRGPSPLAVDFADYADAFGELASRLGFYCSYCERRIPTNLAVEHIQPKTLELPNGQLKYAHLVGRWDNFLLGCVNCNSTKGKKDVNLAEVLLPDRDNTLYAYTYSPDGKIAPSRNLNPFQRRAAEALLSLCGLDKGPNQVYDENGKAVAIDRYAQRMEIWASALLAKADLDADPSDRLRRSTVRSASYAGCFGIWMEVFGNDRTMRRMLIDAFAGTALDCFDQNTECISVRPANGLANCSKV